jgi:hypothetical protein
VQYAKFSSKKPHEVMQAAKAGVKITGFRQHFNLQTGPLLKLLAAPDPV